MKMQRQKGISLFVVLVIVLLTTLALMWSMRTAWFNEKVTSNDADYQRAFEAAQAMISDAERDITQSLLGTSTTRPAANVRPEMLSLGSPVYIPDARSLADKDINGGDLIAMRSLFGANTCYSAVCLSDLVGNLPYPQEFWNNDAQLTAMTASGARYGEYTGMTSTTQSNPVLVWGAGQPAQAWYWIEVLPYQVENATSMNFASMGKGMSMNAESYVYRITAVADGLRPGTRAAIQSVFVPQVIMSTPTAGAAAGTGGSTGTGAGTGNTGGNAGNSGSGNG